MNHNENNNNTPSRISPELRLLTDEEVAKLLRISKNTLHVWRMTGKLPIPYVKIGRITRFRMQDIHKFFSMEK